MPCYDHRDNASYVYENEVEPLRKEVEELRSRNNELAQLLCTAGQVVHKRGLERLFSIELLEWWEEHKDFDRKRGEPWNEDE